MVYDPCLEERHKNIALDGRTYSLIPRVLFESNPRGLRQQLLRQDHGLVIVYNPASRPSFEAIRALYDEAVVARAGLDPIPISIVACRHSPDAPEDVAREEGERFAREHGGSRFACVSLYGHDVAEAFENMVGDMMQLARA